MRSQKGHEWDGTAENLDTVQTKSLYLKATRGKSFARRIALNWQAGLSGGRERTPRRGWTASQAIWPSVHGYRAHGAYPSCHDPRNTSCRKGLKNHPQGFRFIAPQHSRYAVAARHTRERKLEEPLSATRLNMLPVYFVAAARSASSILTTFSPFSPMRLA